jgi:hypothetical protein
LQALNLPGDFDAVVYVAVCDGGVAQNVLALNVPARVKAPQNLGAVDKLDDGTVQAGALTGTNTAMEFAWISGGADCARASNWRAASDLTTRVEPGAYCVRVMATAMSFASASTKLEVKQIWSPHIGGGVGGDGSNNTAMVATGVEGNLMFTLLVALLLAGICLRVGGRKRTRTNPAVPLKRDRIVGGC